MRGGGILHAVDETNFNFLLLTTSTSAFRKQHAKDFRIEIKRFIDFQNICL